MNLFRNRPLMVLAGHFLGLASSSATVLVTEPFDYNVGIFTQSSSENNWAANMGSGSGSGWGSNLWFSHSPGGSVQFGIATNGHTGAFADSTGLNNLTNEWRERKMGVPVHNNTDGSVIWQHLTMSRSGSGSNGQLTTQNSNGGMNYAVRITEDGSYALLTGHGNLHIQTSSIQASTDSSDPDVIVVKMENQTDESSNLFEVSMWVNPTSATGSGLPAPDIQIQGTAPFNNNRNIGSINWMPGNTQIDSFILASAYEDFGIGVVVTGPLIGVKDGNLVISDGSTTPVSFGAAPIGGSVSKTFTITNGGTTDLALGAINKTGTDAESFTVQEPSSTTVEPGATTTFTVIFTPGTNGVKTAGIHILNDTPDDLSSFDISLSGIGLSPTLDTDGDGLNDAAEFHLSDLGFDWEVNQTELVTALFSGAGDAGLYTSDEIHAQNPDTPLLTKDPITNQFKLTMAVLKSVELVGFTPLPLTLPQIDVNSEGELEFTFSSEEKTAFFRVEAR